MRNDQPFLGSREVSYLVGFEAAKTLKDLRDRHESDKPWKANMTKLISKLCREEQVYFSQCVVDAAAEKMVWSTSLGEVYDCKACCQTKRGGGRRRR